MTRNMFTIYVYGSRGKMVTQELLAFTVDYDNVYMEGTCVTDAIEQKSSMVLLSC